MKYVQRMKIQMRPLLIVPKGVRVELRRSVKKLDGHIAENGEKTSEADREFWFFMKRKKRLGDIWGDGSEENT